MPTIEIGLTERQRRVYDYIVAHQASTGYSPDLKEICKGCNLKHKSMAHATLCALKERGYVSWTPEHTRTLVVRKQPSFVLSPKVQLALYKYCEDHEENPAHVVNDLVDLGIDRLTTDRAHEKQQAAE